MACFLVSAAEAVVVTAVKKVEEKKENGTSAAESKETSVSRVPMSRKLKWLGNMLWGGAALLMFEHVWHGEVVPWFPFLTAMSDKADAAEMFHEMATVGIAMACTVTIAWLCMCLAADAIVKRSETESGSEAV